MFVWSISSGGFRNSLQQSHPCTIATDIIHITNDNNNLINRHKRKQVKWNRSVEAQFMIAESINNYIYITIYIVMYIYIYILIVIINGEVIFMQEVNNI